MSGKKNPAVSSVMLILASILAIGPGWADTDSPKDAYLKYRTTFLAAKKIEDVQPLICKKANEEISHTPDDQKPMMFQLLKELSPTEVQIISESVTGEKAVLTLSGKTEPAGSTAKEKTTGTVTLVKEDGAWKIDKEAWDSKIEMDGKSPSADK